MRYRIDCAATSKLVAVGHSASLLRKHIETLNLFASSSELESAVRTQSVRVPTQMIASYF